MKKWVTSYAPFYKNTVTRWQYLPEGTVVISGNVFEDGREWVSYDGKLGYIPADMLEPYVENFPVNCVDMGGLQTPSDKDAAQYIVYLNNTQHNMCGELCVCYMLGLSLPAFLDKWQLDKPSLFKQIFGNGRARGTGARELVQMFGMFDKGAGVLNYKKYTPAKLQAGRVIVSVHIDGVTGRLRGQGVLHWVVVTNVVPERTGGFVEVYNPFGNRIEVYSWAEFIASASMPYGVELL